MDFMLGQYLPVESTVHRLDPRAKLLSALSAMLAVLLADWPGLALTALLAGAGLWQARVGLPLIWGQVRSLALIMAITFILQALFTPGEILFAAGPLTVTRQGLVSGLDLVARLILIIFFGLILTATTTTLNLAAGLESLLKPLGRLRLPVHGVVMAVTIAARFVPVIFDEARAIYEAQISRGAGFHGRGPAGRMAALVSLLVPLLVGAMRRSEELATAMEARCYSGIGRTRLKALAFTAGDAVCLALCGLAPVMVVLLR